MQEARSWRELLGNISTDGREKQRIIEELKITPITLSRWISGESAPRPQNLRHLLSILPEYRDELRSLLREEKGLKEYALSSMSEDMKTISSEFYTRVLLDRATTNENVRFWSTSHMILQQAISQLDTERKGMCLWIVCCMPPSGPHAKVRSLRECIGVGTAPWTGNIEQNAMFLGAESLAGYVVTGCRPGTVHDIDAASSIAPRARVKYEKSATIYPILYAGRIAGVLLVSSTQPYYFLSEARTTLVQHYANLIALAFEANQFYRPEEIALCVMPPQDEQEEHFRDFRQMVNTTMINAAARRQPVNNQQADLLVWQQLEDMLLKLPSLHTIPHQL
ncbi:GAF domain-containing protein [Tengunoibacter tsumagoiensis]|uniref:GAF domain-containing protein n=1 Tax=Tengunoibacter tsumagoiensis TaxID=2014871 RepID=A0A401ZZV8_9CHLR|nr:GAF domain-containing protein [Tengunoibacter tsumagoiensis]GCE12359.1 hypothetical protein KTT_22180 [Tengunoibacter tsumagoiensis]